MYVIGLDVGTTGTKAVVCDENGAILAGGYKEYELTSPKSGWIAQNANDWWDAAVFAIRKAAQSVDRSQTAVRRHYVDGLPLGR